jgi:DNA-binding NarL/FixJ family response regulator
VASVQKHIVILSGRSLFAEGVASRLRQHPQRVKVEVLDAHQPDAVNQIASAQPSAVILDTADTELTQLCLLARLQLALPGLKVICLNTNQSRIQVVTSEQLPAAEVNDLLDVIERLPPSQFGP